MKKDIELVRPKPEWLDEVISLFEKYYPEATCAVSDEDYKFILGIIHISIRKKDNSLKIDDALLNEFENIFGENHWECTCKGGFNEDTIIYLTVYPCPHIYLMAVSKGFIRKELKEKLMKKEG